MLTLAPARPALGRLAALAGTSALAALTLARVASISASARFIDFENHYLAAAGIVGHRGTFAFTRDDAIVFPGSGVLFAPLFALSLPVARQVFLALNLAAAAIVVTLALRLLPASARPRTLGSIAVGCALLNTAPFVETLRLGQISLLIAALLFGSLVVVSRLAGAACLGTALALKASFGLFALLLVARRRVWLCVLALAVFAAIAASPALFGNELYATYRGYLARVQADFAPGAMNDPAVHGANNLSLEVVREPLLRLGLKAAFVALLAYALWRERRARSERLTALLLTACVSMLVVYHRLYDLVLVLPVLTTLLLDLVARGRARAAAPGAALLIFFALPQSAVLALAERLPAGPLFIASPYAPQHLLHVAPVYGVAMLLLTCLAAWLHLESTTG